MHSHAKAHDPSRSHLSRAGNNALPRPGLPSRPRPRPSPSRRRDASSGPALSPTSTAARRGQARSCFRQFRSLGRSFVDGAKPGDALKVTVLSFKPSGWGWTGNIPGFGLCWPTSSPTPRPAITGTTNPGIEARHVRPGRQGCRFGPFPRHDRRGAGPRPGLHSIVPPRNVRRQHGCS